MIHLITGGERSGKSRYAQQQARELSNHPTYLATAVQLDSDPDFAQRIDRHRQERDDRWTTVEEPLHLHRAFPPSGVVVVDCVTLWLNNWLSERQYDRDAAYTAARQEFDQMTTSTCSLLIVTNEVGMGLHASTSVGRDFVELQGWINQYIAERAERVTLMVAGLPLVVKKS